MSGNHRLPVNTTRRSLIVLGIATDPLPWIGVGFVFAVLNGFFSLAQWLQARGRGGRKKRSSLVICPDGLALRQGEMVGGAALG